MARQRLVLSLAVAVAVVGMACGAGMEVAESNSELKARTAPAPAYALNTTDVYTSSPTWKSSFAISATYNIYLAVDVPGTLTGHHQVAVYILAPGGSMYQKNVVSFAAGVTPAAGEQQAQSTSTGFRVWTSLPVAGTTVQQYGMAGTWSSQAWVDNATAANAQASFQLQ